MLDLGRLQADSGVGPVALTRLEVMVLRELMEHPGQSVAKDQLLATVWGIDSTPARTWWMSAFPAEVEARFDLIETVRGAGYELRCLTRPPPGSRRVARLAAGRGLGVAVQILGLAGLARRGLGVAVDPGPGRDRRLRTLGDNPLPPD